MNLAILYTSQVTIIPKDIYLVGNIINIIGPYYKVLQEYKYNREAIIKVTKEAS